MASNPGGNCLESPSPDVTTIPSQAAYFDTFAMKGGAIVGSLDSLFGESVVDFSL